MKAKYFIVVCLCLIMALTGCSGVGKTRVAVVPELKATQSAEAPAQSNSGVYVGTGIYPARWEIGNPSGYTKGLTIELEFDIFNGLPYPSPVRLRIEAPPQSTLNKRLGFVVWDKTPEYVNIIDDGLYIPADGSKTITVSLCVPDSENPPDKWMFLIAYMNTGQLWGSFKQTISNNYIFYPACFTADGLFDARQNMSFLTWGNSPRLMVRAAYDAPPENIDDGRLTYLGLGEQVIRKWLDPDSGKTLDRQYTLFDFTDNQSLSVTGNSMLFYRAWVEHRGIDGLPDGRWDAVGQNMTAAEVKAEVLVTMR